MAKQFKNAVEYYATTPVPDEATVSAFRIALILIGAMITLPVFLAGAHLGLELGFMRGVYTFTIVGFVIAIVGSLSGYIATQYRLTTAMIIQKSFGPIGGAFAASILGLAILGWYGATVDVFAEALNILIKEFFDLSIDERIYKVLASLLMIATAIFGFKALDKLSQLAVPLMILFLGFLVYVAIKESSIDVVSVAQTTELTIAQAISAGVGAFIVGALMFPDICRYAKTPKDAVVASFSGFGIGIPLIMIMAAIPSLIFNEQDFLKVVIIVGSGIQGILLLMLATWTTNAFNLYSSSLVFASIFKKIDKWQIVLLTGVAGTGIALMPILDNFLIFLHFLGLAIPPIAGVFFADFFVNRNQPDDAKTNPTKWLALVSWLVGSLVAYLSMKQWITLTTVSAVDAIIVTFLLHFGIKKMGY